MWVHAQLFSYVWLFAATGTITFQVSLSVEFSSQEYWSGSPFPTSGDLPDTGSSLCLFISSVGGQIHHQLQHLGSRICNSLSVCPSVRVSVCLHWTISDVFSASFKVFSKYFLLQSITFRNHINKFSDSKLFLHPGNKPFLVLLRKKRKNPYSLL